MSEQLLAAIFRTARLYTLPLFPEKINGSKYYTFPGMEEGEEKAPGTHFAHAHNYSKGHVVELGACTNRRSMVHVNSMSCHEDAINIAATCSAWFYTVGYKEKCLVRSSRN